MWNYARSKVIMWVGSKADLWQSFCTQMFSLIQILPWCSESLGACYGSYRASAYRWVCLMFRKWPASHKLQLVDEIIELRDEMSHCLGLRHRALHALSVNAGMKTKHLHHVQTNTFDVIAVCRVYWSPLAEKLRSHSCSSVLYNYSLNRFLCR